MANLKLAFKCSPYIVLLILLGICGFLYHRMDHWHTSYRTECTYANELTQKNADLESVNEDLTNRNNNLVESLNERTQQLKIQTKRADASKRAYQEALVKNPDWGNTRVPDVIANSLRNATGIQNGTSRQGADSR